MRFSPALLIMMILLPVCVFSDTSGIAETEPAAVRHEKWVFMYAVSQRAAAPMAKSEALADLGIMVDRENLRPNRGMEMFFYPDGTFKIRDWFYGESTGLLQSFNSGTYTMPAGKPELELVFTDARKPQAAYFLSAMNPWPNDRDNTILVKAQIVILERMDDSWLKAEIKGIDEKGRTYVLGQGLFTCESLAKQPGWLFRRLLRATPPTP